MRTCVVVPTLNEARGIASVLRGIKPYADDILVVDGGSDDGTPAIAAGVPSVRVLQIATGKGLATRIGLDHTDCDIVVFMDADGSHEPADIPRMIEPIRSGVADIVLASRISGGSDEFRADLDHVLRWLGTKAVTGMVNIVWNTSLTDVLNGFRALNRSRVRTLPLHAAGFEIEIELVAKALQWHLAVAEVPSREYQRQWGVSKLPTLGSVPMLLRLLVNVGHDFVRVSARTRTPDAGVERSARSVRQAPQNVSTNSLDVSVRRTRRPANEKRICVARSRDTILGWTKSGHGRCEWGSYRVSASDLDAVSRRG